MSGVAQFSAFLGLSVAAHLAIWVGSSDDGAQSAGNGGDESVTLAAASEGMAAQVAKWTTPVEVQSTLTAQTPTALPQTAPSVSQPKLDHPSLTAPAPMALPDSPAAPAIHTAPIQAPKPPKSKPVAKPKAAQKSAKPPAKPSKAGNAPVSRKKQTAAGSGGGQAAGQGGKAASSTKSKAKRSTLMARWGAAIRDRVQRRKRKPAGVRASGTVGLRISLSTTGRLQGVSVTRSSGHAALDQAALRAVRSAKFPKAPRGLKAGTYAFNQKMRFTQ